MQLELRMNFTVKKGASLFAYRVWIFNERGGGDYNLLILKQIIQLSFWEKPYIHTNYYSNQYFFLYISKHVSISQIFTHKGLN